MPITTTPRQIALYQETCTIWERKRTVTAGLPSASTTWSSYASGVPYYHESTPNLAIPDPTGRYVEPSILTTDHGHFYIEQPFPQDWILQNTTPGGFKNGYYEALGPGMPTPSASSRRANKKSFMLRQIAAPTNLPATRLQDLFTDADGTLLGNHTMTVGPGWTVSGSTAFAIASNRCKINNAVSSTAYANAGYADGTLTCDVCWQGQARDLALIVRVSDASNLFAFHLNPSSGAVTLYERTAGVDTSRAAITYALDLTSTFALKVVTAGSVLTCYIDGSPVLTYTTSSKASNTRYGIFSGGSSVLTGQTFDNFLFSA